MREGSHLQLNEREVLLAPAESHADVLSAMYAGTDRLWAGWSTKRQSFWQATCMVPDVRLSLSEAEYDIYNDQALPNL